MIMIYKKDTCIPPRECDIGSSLSEKEIHFDNENVCHKQLQPICSKTVLPQIQAFRPQANGINHEAYVIVPISFFWGQETEFQILLYHPLVRTLHNAFSVYTCILIHCTRTSTVEWRKEGKFDRQ